MDEPRPPSSGDTTRPEYARRLERVTSVWWKRLLDVQAPYRWYLRRLRLGRTLDVGCGIGRNLGNLAGAAVGVDHNAAAVARCRAQGFAAYTGDEFRDCPDAVPESFDSLLFSHVLEHMPRADAVQLVRHYLPYLRPSGRVVMITPQERGYASDTTHVEFLDLDALREIAEQGGLAVTRAQSFPFPRPAGRLFTYNEFVLVASAPPTASLRR